MIVLTGGTVRDLLRGREHDVLAAVREAYVRHDEARTSLPHSVFLRFPDDDRSRIIALPAYLGGDEPVVGVKWVASFPGNLARGAERASAAVVLNDPATGQPTALLEGSTISAWRTAASAALAAQLLGRPDDDAGVVLLGCGVINAAVLHFLRVVRPGLREVVVCDADPGRAAAFADRAARAEGVDVRVEADPQAALAAHDLVSVATTAVVPHLGPASLRPGVLVLHVSLRDLDADAVRAAVNVVDDVDHVDRAATSIELAHRAAGHLDFVQGTIGALARRTAAGGSLGRAADRATVFSPFGLGVLDLAVAALVVDAARSAGAGVDIPDFLPAPGAAQPPPAATPPPPPQRGPAGPGDISPGSAPGVARPPGALAAWAEPAPGRSSDPPARHPRTGRQEWR